MPSIRRFHTAALGGFALAAGLVPSAVPASAGVVAQINQSNQTMRVFVNGRLAHIWPVSTARSGFVTPNGSYRVGLMAPMWRSHKYHNSPMPHAMFFRGGYAIHGTYAVGHLGRRASHGCVRLAPGHAAALYGLTQSYGGTRVVIQN